MLRRVPTKNYRALGFYRRAIKVIKQLEYNHQQLWYDYLRLKFEENATIRDPKRIKQVLEEGEESLEWTLSILKRKDAIDRSPRLPTNT